MEFILTYRGSLKANGSPQHKQEIRRNLQSQLKKLWTLPPLNIFKPDNIIAPDGVAREPLSIIRKIKAFEFVPLVNQHLKLIAEIKVTLLRPETPGSIITTGGDIDNRLKTLFDAFRMPENDAELPKDDSPGENEKPFYCLLESDSLITSISVETETLLTHSDDNSYVELLINVKTKALEVTNNNIVLA